MDGEERKRRARLRHHAVTGGQLFSCMDRDRSNRITIGEFKRGLAMVGMHPARASLHCDC